jgi:hypothetical protein
MKRSGLMIILCFLYYSPLVIAQNFTSHPRNSIFPAATMTKQFPAAIRINTGPQYFAQPVFLFQRIIPPTTSALPMKQIIKTDDQAFAKKMFSLLAPEKNQIVNFKILPISTDSSQTKSGVRRRK